MLNKKIIALGCSITHHVGWADRLSKITDIPCVNLSESSGSNFLQRKRFQELVFSNNVNKNDIIIWQITASHRKFLRSKINQKLLKQKNKEAARHSYSLVMQSKNIFDNQDRIDFLSHANKLPMIDIEQELEDLLFYIISAKNLVQNTFVVYGWNTVLPEEYVKVFEDQLEIHNIDLIPEPIVDWCHKKNLEFHPDNAHPKHRSLQLYTEEYLLPYLQNKIGIQKII